MHTTQGAGICSLTKLQVKSDEGSYEPHIDR